MRVRLLSLVVGSAIVAALLAGCGGGGSSSGGEGGEARLTHAEWVSQADAVCAVDHKANFEGEGELEALIGAGLTSPKIRDEAAKVLRAGAPNVETELKGIKALRPAPEDEAEVGRVIAGLERSVALDEQIAEALETGSVHELEALIDQANANGKRLAALANGLGTKVCGRPGAGVGTEAAGGGGDEAGRAAWTAQADEICRSNREANIGLLEEFQSLARAGLESAKARQEAAALIRAGIVNVEREIKSFKGLTAPTAVDSEFQKLIAKIEALTDVEGEFAELLDNGETQALPGAVGRVAKAELAVRGLAIHLGLRACGKLLQSEGGHSLA
jgi:hypothetical protein